MGDSSPSGCGPPASGPAAGRLAVAREAELAIVKLRVHPSVLARPAAERLAATLGLLPDDRRQSDLGGGAYCAWLAPGEWLLIGPEAEIAPIARRAVEALAGEAALVVDRSHADTAFLVRGAQARARIAAGCPLDLRPQSFPENAVARSLFGEADLFVARLSDRDGEPCFRLIVDQTMAGYLARRIAA